MNRTPAVVLVNPKYPHNVGNAFRACAALGASPLYVTGHRAQWETTDKGRRLPREERMRIYKDQVELVRTERPFDDLQGMVPVAVEISPTAEPLAFFDHPGNACYVFGPEDGSIPKAIRGLCHRFVILPTDHCINLAAAVNCVLMDRRVKRQLAGLESVLPAYATLQEDRGLLMYSNGNSFSFGSGSSYDIGDSYCISDGRPASRNWLFAVLIWRPTAGDMNG